MTPHSEKDLRLFEVKYSPVPTPSAVSDSTMEWNNTGSWRYIRPVYENKLSPCNDGCPCGNDVAGFLRLAQDGHYKKAWELIRETSPFPGICGRACYHPCETVCNRAQYDQPIAIHSVERFLADSISDEDAAAPRAFRKSGKRVAVVGSGPAGLSCAYHLARMGYGVTVFEALPEPGGMLRYGIPEYRLPKDVVRREINQILDFGIELRVNQRLGRDISLGGLKKEFNAVYLAFGAYRERDLGVPGEDAPLVLKGLDFLYRISGGERPEIGRKVLVIGGGNTAIDVARSALRIGAQVVVGCIEQENEMPAHHAEVLDAKEEGVEFMFGVLVKRIREKDKGLSVDMVPARLSDPDDGGWRKPVELNGNLQVLCGDTLIKAIGQSPDLSCAGEKIPIRFGRLAADGNTWMVEEGVFAGGDLVAGAPGTVSGSIGLGRYAAESIGDFLEGRPHPPRPEVKLTPYQELNTAYFQKEERVQQRRISISERRAGFREIDTGMLAAEVIYESKRCFQCGNCTMCDNCLVFCPDMAITRKENEFGYTIDYFHCKGCGICIKECPRDALSAEKESKWK